MEYTVTIRISGEKEQAEKKVDITYYHDIYNFYSWFQNEYGQRFLDTKEDIEADFGNGVTLLYSHKVPLGYYIDRREKVGSNEIRPWFGLYISDEDVDKKVCELQKTERVVQFIREFTENAGLGSATVIHSREEEDLVYTCINSLGKLQVWVKNKYVDPEKLEESVLRTIVESILNY